MNFFSKKDDGLLDEKMRLTKLYLDQQREENSDLREEFASLKELSLRNKLMLDDLKKNANINESTLKSLEKQNEGLESLIQTNNDLIIKLGDEIEQLKGVKNTYLPTDFQIVSTQNEEIQQILDRVSDEKETICFKDIDGKLWQIAAKEFENEEDFEDSNIIDEVVISVNLNC